MTKSAVKEERKDKKLSTRIIYVYSTDDNKNYVKSLSSKLNLTESEIINKLIDAYKNNKKANLKKFVPLYVKMAEKWIKRNKQRS